MPRRRRDAVAERTEQRLAEQAERWREAAQRGAQTRRQRREQQQSLRNVVGRKLRHLSLQVLDFEMGIALGGGDRGDLVRRARIASVKGDRLRSSLDC